MKIEFGRIEIHNFMSYADEVFDFGSHDGMNLVVGKNNDVSNSSNGSGKSSIQLSLVYALYGQMPYKLKNENIYNRYSTDRNMRVVLWFSVDDNRYKVVSGLNRGKQSVCSLFSIDSNGNETDITKSTIQQTRQYIATELLHSDISLFMRTTVLNSDPMLNFFNLSGTEKKVFCDKMFDLEKFALYFKEIHRDVLALDRDISTNQNTLMVLNRNDEEYVRKCAEFDKENSERIRTLTITASEKKTELEKKKSSVVKKNTELIDKCRTNIEKADTILKSLGEKNHKIDMDANTLKMSMKRYEGAITDRKNMISKHAELRNKLCDDCKVVFSRHYNLDKYQNEIEKLELKIGTDRAKISELSVSKNENNVKIREVEKKRVELNRKMDELNSEYDRQQNEIKMFERDILRIENEIENKKNTKNPYISLCDENKKRIEDVVSETEKLITTYNHKKFLEEMVSQDTLKRYIIRDLIGYLNKRIRYYLHKLGANYDIVFDEDMNYEFITASSARPEYHNFSSGEQARISISTCFAFRDFLSIRSNISSNILILDEFIDSNIDSTAIENILEILKEFVERNGQNIYVVSHRSEVSTEYFNGILHVEKTNNISKLNFEELN